MKLNFNNTTQFIDSNKYKALLKEADEKNKLLHSGEGEGNDFLGWITLPEDNSELITDIEQHAETLRKSIDTMVVIGIGGSYLGAKAVYEALSDNFAVYNQNSIKIIFAGQNIGEDYLYDLRKFLQNRSYAITVISKSGTTTEPAIAFRFLKKDMEEKYGKAESAKRITVITDKERGALKSLANQENYKSYVIPDNVGGRFSVLTPVGLFPIAVAGFDIKQLMAGALNAAKLTSPDKKSDENIAVQYAAMRNMLYEKSYNIEILVNYEPRMSYFSEWWKQLYGESEGKNGKGIFPASVNFTTDLHSLGQYIQDGERKIFETVVSIQNPKHELVIPTDDANLDNLNYIAGKRIDEVNKKAELGTLMAHVSGGVPNIHIEIPKLDEYNLGELIYFFEKACGISGYLLGVNPFDQPGVEAYKNNMFALLGKPGFELIK